MRAYRIECCRYLEGGTERQVFYESDELAADATYRTLLQSGATESETRGVFIDALEVEDDAGLVEALRAAQGELERHELNSLRAIARSAEAF